MSEKKLAHEPETIVAVDKEGLEKEFTKQSWDLLGPDKQGLEVKVAKPALAK